MDTTTTTAAAPVQVPTRNIAQKALRLPVELAGPDKWRVASGSQVGVFYLVYRLDDGADYYCNCVGHSDCSHIWAARAKDDPVVRRALRQAAKTAERKASRP